MYMYMYMYMYINYASWAWVFTPHAGSQYNVYKYTNDETQNDVNQNDET